MKTTNGQLSFTFPKLNSFHKFVMIYTLSASAVVSISFSIPDQLENCWIDIIA